MKKLIFTTLLLALFGCTTQSTRIAQENSIRVQATQNGIFQTTMRALARENYDTAFLQMQVAVLRAQMDMPDADRKRLDEVLEKSGVSLKQFAMKRDAMMEYMQDFERANALKAVSVDAKLFSEQGILNYIGSTLSESSDKLFNAWDVATQNMPKTKSVPTSQPSK